MNGVIGTIDLLRQTDLDGAQHRLSTIIRDSAFSLLGILDDILDFSKIEAGKLQIDNTTFSVTDTIEEVARVLSSVAKKRKLDLQLSIAPDIPKNLIGDNIRVRQVLYNLCSNAIKFTTTDENRQGFVKVAVEVAQNTSEHYTLRFSVTDNGKGMTQLQLREIFNPFIQAENSITREYGGTGLGLSICKSLIELMLGSINVTSDLGMGSEFVVELPFSTDGKIEYANKAVMAQKPVAVLTKNSTRKAILCRYLSFMGANIFPIESIDDAEELLQTPSLIWVLDGLDGMAPVNDQLRSLLYSLEQNNQQVIVLSTMDESALNHANIFYLNAAPLCKSSFMTSIMVAAGLHKPKQLKQAKSFNNFLNVDKARAENKLVLLAEDNVLNQQVLTDQLHLLGYGVEVAENGEEGLAMWKKNHYPIILTDLHMPKMSGYDMVKAIRDEAEKSHDIKAQPYIIAVTANALKGEKERCIATGMNDYITKPIELNVLEATLAKWQPEKHIQMSASQESSEDDSTLSDENTETSDELSISSAQQAKNESTQFENVVDHEPKAETSKTDTPDVSTAFDSDLSWSEEVSIQPQAAIEDDDHTIDIDTLTKTDNDHLSWQGPDAKEKQSSTIHEHNYALDLSLQSHEANNLEWQENTSSTPSSHIPHEETLDLSQFGESDSDLEWKDDLRNAQVDEFEHEINIDNIEVDSQDNIDWQNLNDIDETVSAYSEDKTETTATGTLTEETEEFESAAPTPPSALTGSLSSISLESTWEAKPAAQTSNNQIPTPSFGLAPEGTSQDALNPASTQLDAAPEIKVLVEDTIEVDTPNEAKAIEPESGQVEPEVETTTEDDLPAEESIEEPQVDISTLAVVDIDMFDKYVNHDEAKKLRFFRMYLEQSSELIRDIFANVMTREQDKIISDCHQLKSISKTVGAMQVAEIAIQFEQACKDRELTSDELISFRDKLDDYYTDAMMFMQDFIKQRSE
jgi:CheY-like chemotaxis protein